MTSLHVPDIMSMKREREAATDGFMAVGEHIFFSSLTYPEEEEKEIKEELVMFIWVHLLVFREENGCQLILMI